jgi:hypothetical protein
MFQFWRQCIWRLCKCNYVRQMTVYHFRIKKSVRYDADLLFILMMCIVSYSLSPSLNKCGVKFWFINICLFNTHHIWCVSSITNMQALCLLWIYIMYPSNLNTCVSCSCIGWILYFITLYTICMLYIKDSPFILQVLTVCRCWQIKWKKIAGTGHCNSSENKGKTGSLRFSR